MLKDIKIFQIGNGNGLYYIFSPENLSTTITPSLKIKRADNQLTDGYIRNNGLERDLKGSNTVEIEFLLSDEYGEDIDGLTRLLNSGVIPLFYVQELKNGALRFLVNFGSCVGQPQKTSNASEDLGLNDKAYVVTFETDPFFYEFNDDDLRFIDFETWDSSKHLWGVEDNWGSFIWGGGFQAFKELSPLSLEEKKNYFNSCEKKDRIKPFYLYHDLFFEPNCWTVSGTDNVISQTLTTNNLTNFTTSGIDLKTNFDNKIFVLQIGSLDQNEWVEIVNIDTNSGLKLTWLDTTASPVLFYNSVLNILTDTTGNEITFSSGKFKIERSLGKPFLYFSGIQNETGIFNQNIISKKEFDNYTMQKNTPGNLDVKIKILKTYQ